MADTKISALTNASALTGTEKFAASDGTTTSKAATAAQIQTFSNTNDVHSGYSDYATISPAAPGTGYSRFFAKDQGGRPMPAFMGPSGLDSVLQPHMGKNGWAQWRPAGNSTTISAIGGAALTATGTATTANYATTSLHTRAVRVDYLVTTAATTAVAGFRFGVAKYRPTDGYHFIFRVCPATGVATASTARFFCGMRGSTSAPTDVEPSTLTNICGVGYGSADADWQFYTNSASGTATATSTGLARPTTDRQGIFTVIIFIPPGGGNVGIRLTDEVSGTSYDSGALTTNLPASTTAQAILGYHSVGGTSSVTGLTLFGGYIETDN